MGSRRVRAGRRRGRPGLEPFEGRVSPTVDLASAFAVGASGGSTPDIRVNAVALDAEGNLYWTGSIRGTADLDPGPGVVGLSSTGSRDAFVVKSTPAGSVAWAARFAGLAGTAVGQGSAIAVDAQGRVAVAGRFSGSVDFDPGAEVSTLESPGRTDPFVARLDAHGGLLWARSMPGPTTAVAGVNALALDPSGGVVVGGSFQESASFGPTTLAAASAGDAGFVARLTPAGAFDWARRVGNEPGAVSTVLALGVDGSGRVAFAGRFSGAVDLDPGPGVDRRASAGVTDASGGYLWGRGFGGVDVDSASALAFDAAGAIYLGGYFAGSVDFDPGPGMAVRAATGDYDAFAAKFSADGAFLWARGFAGQGGSAQASGIGVDASGRVHLAGTFSGSMSTTSSPNPPAVTSAGGTDGFLASFDPAGTFAQVRRIGGANSDTASALAINPGGRLAVVGTFAGNLSVIDAATLTAPGTRNVFLATLAPSAPPAPGAPALLAASDTGASSSDRLTAAAMLRFDVQGAAASNVVRLLRDGAVVASRTGPGELADASATADGVYSYAAVQVDAAGNASPAGPVTVVTVDRTSPAAPAAPRLRPEDDSGLAGDGVTNVARPRFTGTAEPGARVELFEPNGGLLGWATAAGDGSYEVQPASAPAERRHLLAVRAVDRAGNVGPAGPTPAITFDRTAPPPPAAPTLGPADDTGTLGDNITSRRRPAVRGQAEPGATVHLLEGSTVLATAAAGADGAYQLIPAANLAEGVRRLRVRATDAAGNVGAAGAELALAVDATPPATPAAPTLLAADDTGVPGDGVTARRRPRLVGTAEPFSVVEWVNASGSVVATATASASGAYTLQQAGELSVGARTPRVRARDAAGNSSELGPAFALRIVAATADFDGDGRTEIGVFRPSTAFWIAPLTGGGGWLNQAFGAPNFFDIPVLGDYDGDGIADLAAFRPSTAEWWIFESRTQAFRREVFGATNLFDIPVPADFDGDGRADLAVFRPSTAEWWIFQSSTRAFRREVYGAPDLFDIPIPADFDGDGRADLSVFRVSTAEWIIHRSSTATFQIQPFGAANLFDVPVPGDYDGDGRADFAVFRPSTAEWIVFRSSTSAFQTTAFGATNLFDLPLPGPTAALVRLRRVRSGSIAARAPAAQVVGSASGLLVEPSAVAAVPATAPAPAAASKPASARVARRSWPAAAGRVTLVGPLEGLTRFGVLAWARRSISKGRWRS